VVVVTHRQVDALHALFQQLVATLAPLVGVVVDGIRRPDVLEQPGEELRGVGREVPVVVIAGRPLLAEGGDVLLEVVEFRQQVRASRRGLVAAGPGLLEEFARAALEGGLLAFVVDECAGRLPERPTLLDAHVDVAHGGLAPEDHRADRLRGRDRARVRDELAHLLVDVGGDHDGPVRRPGVVERRHQRRERLARATGPLEEDVPAGAERVVDPAHRRGLVRVELLVGEKPHVPLAAGVHALDPRRKSAKGFPP
jgi:hypothetical protein